MKLKEVIAEYLYNQDNGITDFENADSNTRDYYFLKACDEIPQILGSYLTSKGNIYKLIHGAVRQFVDAHETLTISNMGSLTRRIIKSLNNDERNLRLNK
jgi:hypothetical protein